MSMDDLYELVELLEWTPNAWKRCEVVGLLSTPIGYVFHTDCQGYVLYHLISGVNLDIVVPTEELAVTCLERLVDLVDWWSVDLLPRDIQPVLSQFRDTMIAQGYPLRCAGLGSVYE